MRTLGCGRLSLPPGLNCGGHLDPVDLPFENLVHVFVGEDGGRNFVFSNAGRELFRGAGSHSFWIIL